MQHMSHISITHSPCEICRTPDIVRRFMHNGPAILVWKRTICQATKFPTSQFLNFSSRPIIKEDRAI